MLLIVLFISFLTEETLAQQGILGFTIQPQDRIIILGTRNVSIPCNATSNSTSGTVIILWKHNQTTITDYTNKHFMKDQNGSIVFEQFLQRDVGTYQCVAILYRENIKQKQIESRLARIQAAYIGQRFQYASSDLKIKISSTGHIQCITPASIPLPKISWYKDRKALTGYNNQSQLLGDGKSLTITLELSNFGLNNVGTYQCKAENELLGITRESHLINVTLKAEKSSPYFLHQPTPLTVVRFLSGMFDCVILGEPMPSIQWFKGNTRLQNNNHYQILSNGSLIVRDAIETMEGLYKCVGSNFYASITSVPVQLTVAFIDYDFKLNPESFKITLLHRDLILNCIPPKSHPLNPQIEWSFNHNDLGISERHQLLANGSLLIQNVTRSDEGSYFCMATNSFTKETRSSTNSNVTVYVPPTISTSTRIKVKVGDAIMITCQASGIPTPSITISRKYENGTVLEKSNSFVVLSATVEDKGIYLCRAESDAGEAKVNISLSVLVPPYIGIPLKNQTAVYKQTSQTEFTCSIKGQPKPLIHWMFRGQPLQEFKNKISFAIRNESLTLDHVDKVYEGWFECYGTNEVGNISSSAFLKVYERPVLLNSSASSVEIPHFGNATLFCQVQGDPKPHIQWTFNNRSSIPHSIITKTISYTKNRTYFSESQLQLSHVTYELHHGMFECVVENLYGRVVQQIQVSVSVLPIIKEFTATSAFKQNTSLSVICLVHGSPSPIIKLFHDGNVVLTRQPSTPYESALRWNVTLLDSTNAGVYTCKAENKFGVADKNLSVLVKVTPDRPILFNLTAISSRSLYISWNEPFDGHSNITHFILQITNQTHASTGWWNYKVETTSYSIDNLIPYMKYDVMVQAVNVIGSSEYSVAKEVVTFPSEPSRIEHLLATHNTSRSVTLQWRSPALPNGPIDFYQISSNVCQTLTIASAKVEFTLHDHVVDGLVPFTMYFFQMRAGNKWRGDVLWSEFSDEVRVRTAGEAPVAMVTNITIHNLTSTSFVIQYQLSNVETMYGQFKGIHLRLVSSSQISHQMDTLDTWFLFENLLPYTVYDLQIAVRNHVGLGNYTGPFAITTAPSVPGKVENITATEINITTVHIAWQPPLRKNGVIELYKLSITSDKKSNEVSVYMTNVTHVYSSNFTSNTTYIIHVIAQTSVGFGEQSDGIHITISKEFQGLLPTPITTLSPPIPSRSRSWLDREYLVVIMAVSALAVFLLLALFVICCIRWYFNKKEKVKNRWEVNPYYGNNNTEQEQVVGNKFTKKRRGSFNTITSTVVLKEYQQQKDQHFDDFIWDDNTVNDIFDGSSIEPDYARPITPQSRPPPSVSSDGDRAVYSCVDPYQGRSIDLSPLVRLKGMNKNKRHPKIPASLRMSPIKIAKSPAKDPLPPATVHVNHQASAQSSDYSTSLSSGSWQNSRSTNIPSSETSSISRLDIGDMYDRVAKQPHTKQRGRQETRYADIVPLPHGELGVRNYDTQY